MIEETKTFLITCDGCRREDVFHARDIVAVTKAIKRLRWQVYVDRSQPNNPTRHYCIYCRRDD